MEGALVGEVDEKAELFERKEDFASKERSRSWLWSPWTFLAVICVDVALIAMLNNGLLVVVLPTLEKRFGFSNAQLGIVAAGNDVSGMIFSVVLGYLGDTRHRPRIIGIGSIMIAVGAMAHVLPHIIDGPYQVPRTTLNSSSLCDIVSAGLNKSAGTECRTSMQGWSIAYLAIIFIAQFISGIGSAPMLSLGTTYLDDRLPHSMMPLVFGAVFLSGILGPSLGFIIAGTTLRFYVDINQPAGLSLTPADPRWIGAWWVGFVMVAVPLLLLGVLILFYPDELNRRARKAAKATANDSVGSNVFEKIRQTSSSGLFWCLSFSILSKIFALTGSNSFAAKILVERYGLSSQRSGIFMGTLMIPATIIGVVLGSLLSKRIEASGSRRMLLIVCFVSGLVSGVMSLGILLPGCSDTTITGVDVPYQIGQAGAGSLPSSSISIGHQCNKDCRCDGNRYQPVCGQDGVTYFSLCHAGCTFSNKTHGINCSCVSNMSNGPGSVTANHCRKNCSSVRTYFATAVLRSMFAVLTISPHNTVLIRSVPNNLRSFMLGLQASIIRAFGFIPAPIVYGAILDRSCKIWKEDSCGRRTSCAEYYNNNYAYPIGFLGLGLEWISASIYLVGFCLLKPKAAVTT